MWRRRNWIAAWASGGRRTASYIVYEEVDERHIPIYRIMHQGKDEVGENAQEDHRYPFTGQANATVRLAVVSAEGGEPVWLDLDTDDEFYIARVFWWKDGSPGAQIAQPRTEQR